MASLWVMREKFRLWWKAIETYFIEVVFGVRSDFKAKLARALLSVLAKVYYVSAMIHRRLVKMG